MALIKYGGGIVQMSGSIAGNTYARNRYGNYARARTKPINPNTDSQVKARSIFDQLTEIWSDGLSVAQRASWGVYADNEAMKNKLGETIHLSGYNHFIRSNAARYQYHPACLVINAPTDFTLPAKDNTLVIDVDAAPQLITVTFNNTRAWCAETLGLLLMYQGLPQNGQRNFFAGPWHYLKGFHGSPAPTSPWGTDPYYAVAEGQKCWLRCRISRADGRLSEPWQVSTVVHSEAPFEVPMLLGLNQAQAEGLLAHQQLTLGNVTNENSDTVPVDLIISSDPVAGTILHLNAPVDIVVSLGPA